MAKSASLINAVLALIAGALIGTFTGNLQRLVLLGAFAALALVRLWIYFHERKEKAARSGKAILERIRVQALGLMVSTDPEGWASERCAAAASRLEEDAQRALDEHAPESGVTIDKGRYHFAPGTSPSSEQVFRDRVRYVAIQLERAIAFSPSHQLRRPYGQR